MGYWYEQLVRWLGGIMENFINSLSKYKPGTVEWLNEANRIFRSQTGRDLTREELRRLYSSYERTYTPNWTNPTTYSGKPGNVVFDNKPQTKSQAKRPATAPKAQITEYKAPVNNRVVGGSPLQVKGPTAISAQPTPISNPPSTVVNPNYIIQSGTPLQSGGATLDSKLYQKYPVGQYNPNPNFTMGQGSSLTPGYTRPQPVQPQLPSTELFTGHTLGEGSPLRPGYTRPINTTNTIAGYLPAPKPGTPMSGIGSLNYPNSAPGTMGKVLDVAKGGWGRAKDVVANTIDDINFPKSPTAKTLFSNIVQPVKGAYGFLTAPSGSFSKLIGGASALGSSVPFYNAMYNPDATPMDRMLDTATGIAFLGGAGTLVPPNATILGKPVGLLAQGVGKVSPWVGAGLSAIPRSYNNKKQQQPVPQQPKPVVEEEEKTKDLTKPTPIADQVAYGANITTGTKLPVSKNYTPAGLSDTQNMIIRIAREEGVDPALALAVAGAESGFNAGAVSPAGAIGLMQLMPGTAKGLGVDPFVPEQNVRGGLRYLRNNMKRYGNSLNLALAGYNAGPGAVDRYGGVPPYKETQNYINTIASNKKKWDSILAGSNIGKPTAPTAGSNPIMNAFMPPAQAGTVNNGQVAGMGSNPYYAIPEPQNDNSSMKMLLEWVKSQPQTSMNVDISSMGGTGYYNPYQWLLPEELDKLKQLNDLYDNFSPEDYMNDLRAYAEWLQRARAKDQALGNISNTPTFSADGGYNPANIRKDMYSLYNDRLKAEQNLYDTLMKRADSRYMSYRYGLPFTSFKDNTGDVLQYIVKPTMEQQWKEKNRVPDTMMELIKKENEGEITRRNEREKGRIDIAKTNNEWGNFRYPGMMNTLSSIEARNASDNQTKALGYYTEALKTDAINQRIYDLTKLGLPAEMAGSMAMALGYLPTESPQAKQIINYIMSMTGLNANQLPQSLLNTGEGLTGGDDSGMVLQGFMGVGNGN